MGIYAGLIDICGIQFKIPRSSMKMLERNYSRQVINDRIRCRALLTTSELPIHPETAFATIGRQNGNKQRVVTCL